MIPESDEFWAPRRRADLRLILRAAWNPIASGVPTGEYRHYVSPIAALLDRGASEAEIERELRTLRIKRMGTGRWPRDSIAADFIYTWYTEGRGLSRDLPRAWTPVEPTLRDDDA